MSAADAELRAHQTGQRVAADPSLSAWVAANAGSGKTRVLVDRVTRLLLAGTRPSGILCLTFTKAAAAEMAIRLTDRLGAWTTANDEKLKTELQELLGRRITADDMAAARRLFARTLESPGGLRLQTVHAFCESLLQRFPVEAGVPPGFRVADDAATAELFALAQEKVLTASIDDADFAPVVRFFAERMDDGRFRSLLSNLLGRRRDLAVLLAESGGAEGAIGRLHAQLGLAPDATRDGEIRRHIGGMALADLRRATAALLKGGKTDGKLGATLDAYLASGCLPERFEAEWLPAFFTRSDPGKVVERLASKAAEQIAEGCDAILKAEQERLVALRLVLNALTIAESTGMLLRLAERLLDCYAALKAARGLLDYDDLILRSRDLLVEPTNVPWVMFKLDQGIDHILVDEAQDTSPDQWSVIAALAEDFFSGLGARDVLRTIFAVGDVKQSIYSFQGARPKAFLDMRRDFARRAEAAGQRLHAVPLEMSFRSAPAVLQLVDAVFAGEAERDGVGEDGKPLQHRASRREEAGRIELWAPFRPDPLAQSEAWDVPLDYVGQKDPRKRLAECIAQQIKNWIDREELPSQGRRIRPGDVMILVRRRNVFFEAMVQALKKADVPVAGADRMQLAEQIAVLDLLAIGSFCLLPEDDLNLATVLKGPLFGFSEDDLFALCWQREEKRLWHELLRRAGEQPHWQAAADELRHLMARADLVTPFAFYAELLGAGGGRRRLVARLGAQANEPIDEFVAATLNYEREAAPSLQGFLDWFPRHAGEVKRDLEQSRDEVRVLTVHGAKGLEAPIVILPDTCDLPQERDGEGLLWTEATEPSRRPAAGPAQPVPQLYWPMRKDCDTPLTASIRTARRAEQMAEYRRLLYVALTRARDRLYVCGYLNGRTAEKGPPAQSWYALVEAGMNRLAPVTDCALPWDSAGETSGRRFETHPEQRGSAKAADAPTEPAQLPAWARQPAPEEPSPPKPLTPSRPSREAPPPLSPVAADRVAGLARGRLIHRLLQTLPELDVSQREEATRRFLAHPAHRLAVAAQAEIAAEVLRLLEHPEFAELFGPGAEVEAPIAGRIGNRLVSGQVDRLIVRNGSVLVVDYKTNRPPPDRVEDVDPAYLEQMALYRGLLRQIFPRHAVRTALLWTYAPRLMPLPDGLLDDVLAALTAT